MKTRPSARRLVRIRLFLVCAALASIVGFEFRLSETLATRIGQITARQTDTQASPDVSISDLMAAAR